MTERAELEHDTPDEIDAPEPEATDETTEVKETEGEEATEAEADEDEGDIVVTIGEESPPSDDDEESRAPEWVRDLRRNYREEKKRRKELEEQLKSAGAAKAAELGEKPTLEACDYDAEKYEQSLADWFERKRQHDAEEQAKKAEQEKAEQEWNAKLQSYETAKQTLKLPDYDDAEDVVKDTFSVTQQGMILQGADDPALVVYALGKRPEKVKELASITDPVKFAFAVAKLETQVKTTRRKASAPPESKLSGTARTSGAVDNTLERLREEAAKTGDFTKVNQYKRKLRAKA